MSILELAKIIDNSLTQDEFVLSIQKAGAVCTVLIRPTSGAVVEFCKVGGVYGCKIKDDEFELRSSEFENLLSPYLGKRIFLHLMHS